MTRLFQRAPTQEALRADPFAYLDYDNRAQRALADLLEGLADSLPDDVDRATAALAAGLLRSAIAHHDAIEEEALFPLIEARAPVGAPLRRAVAIARREHGETVGRAIELAEEIESVVRAGRARNPESLGFMLRAFFDALRRHVDWAEATIYPQARELLTREDLVELGLRLSAVAARETGRDRRCLTVIEGGAAEADDGLREAVGG